MRISSEQAIEKLQSGQVVALPTETVYGLAALLSNPEAIAKVFKLKGRPAKNPLIIHVSQMDEIFSLCPPFENQLRDTILLLGRHFWPGPLSLILPVDTAKVPSIARAGLETAAFRLPAHLVVKKIIAKAGPLVMPSANLSGLPSATTAMHVEHDFGQNLPVVDGGLCEKGLESTVLGRFENKWCIFRQGALPREAFLESLGYLPEIIEKNHQNEAEPLCPGQLFKHYSPKAKLTLQNIIPENYEGTLLGFHGRRYPQGCKLRVIGSLDSPESIAENLYASLRELDQDDVKSAMIDFNLPQTGLWQTLIERLRRAAE